MTGGQVVIVNPRQLHLMGSDDMSVRYHTLLFPVELISFQSQDELEQTVFHPLRTGKLILLYPAGGKSSLCIEMKVPKRKGSQACKQSKFQVAWQSLVERYGSTYVVCHGLMEFIDAVCRYIRVNPKPYKENALNLYPTYR